MSLISRFFAGQEIILPGAYFQRKITGGFQNLGTLGNVFFLVGESEGGIPYNAKDYDETTELPAKYKVNQLQKYQDAVDKLISGELFDAARFSFTPALDTRFTAPPLINCIRVNNATRSSVTEKETKPAGTDCAKWQSVDFGTHVNTIAKKITTGTNAGKKVEVMYRGQTYIKDDITHPDFTVNYIGAGAVATLTITATNITIIVDAATIFDITKAVYKTIGEVIDLINSNPDFTATLNSERDWETKYLDYLTTQDIKTTPYVVKSDAEWLKRIINNSFGDIVYYSLITTTTQKVPANDSAWVYLTGGTVTAATTTDWANALVMAEGLNIDFIVVLTGNITNQLALKSHCEYMNSISGLNERLGYTGSGVSTTKTDIISYAKSLNSSSVIYGASRFKQLDQYGIEKSYAGYHVGAMCGALMAGNGTGFPITLKQLNITGLVDNWDVDDLKELINARTIVLQETLEGGTYPLQRALTTYQGENLLMSSPAAMSIMLNISKDFRAKLKQKIADLDTPLNQAVINILRSYIKDEVLPEYKRLGKLTDDPETGRKAFENVQFSILGDQFTCSFDGVVPTELNFVFATGNFKIIGQI